MKNPNEQSSLLLFNEFLDCVIELTNSFNTKSEDYGIIDRINEYLKILETAFSDLSDLSDKKKIISSGVEWFLDNYYILQETADLIQNDLPKDYFRKLPSIEEKNQPRIFILAKKILGFYQISFVQNDLHRFMEAYQKEIVLNMSELWALPLMLRLTLLEVVTANIFRLYENGYSDNKICSSIQIPSLSSDEIVARSIRTLVLLDRIDWKEFFENHSIVDEILAGDSSGVYRKMDFETRDLYRKKVEQLSEHCDLHEPDIANIAVDLASQTNSKNNNKEAHVGYFLIGNGEDQLRSSIGYQCEFGEKFENFFYKNNTFIYLMGIMLITLMVVSGIVYLSQFFMAATWQLLLLGFVSVIPASSVAVNLMNSILTATLPAKLLPKMDFSKKVPKAFRTMVAIPALMSNKEDINFLLKQIELHYLANQDSNIGFILLLDFSDAPHENMPEDDLLRECVINGIKQLNERYQGEEGNQPFYLLHRCRQWNPNEGVWMGWERKRGKLADFNRYLLEGFDRCVDTFIGDKEFLKSVKFVITLDADTILPRDSAKELIGTLAHPLNQAQFKEETSEVISGYTILQPRTEVKPTSLNRTFFTKVFAGDLGLDLYTRAVSDVYQDLFDEGIFVGKGIYDVRAFQRSITGKVPNNTLLSHDLFEGLQGRAGLVSDIVFYEDYPPNYASQVQRLHRWVRGDWQLLPWLLPKVPQSNGGKKENNFSILDKWKIIDNLRRSLLSPTTFLLLVLGWLFLNNGEWLWTTIVLFISAFPLIKDIVTSFTSRFLLGARSNFINKIRTAFFRWILWLIFLPYESLIMVDAVASALVRMVVSHQHLLQWQTSAHTVRLFGKEHKITAIWHRMLGAPISSFITFIVISVLHSDSLLTATPLLLAWFISPQISYWISKPQKSEVQKTIPKEFRQKLRNIARMTWLYFERFIGPDDHWLPPDHFQEDPKGVIAHRTSPTNIGLMLLSTSAAYDFGYIGILDFIYRINYSFETLDQLEKYRGHLLNWYDTQTLESLTPRYVSTVDSGNFAMSLIGLYQTLEDIENHCIIPTDLFQGIYDSLDVFCKKILPINHEDLIEAIKPLIDQCHKFQQNIEKRPITDIEQIDLLYGFQEKISKPMEVLVQKVFDTDVTLTPQELKSIRYYSDSIFSHINNIIRQIDILAPWIQTWINKPNFIDGIEDKFFRNALDPWNQTQNLQMSVTDLVDLCNQTLDKLGTLSEIHQNQSVYGLNDQQTPIFLKWINQFKEDLFNSRENVTDVLDQIQTLQEKINFYVKRMEFDFLLDKKREVFNLGYQVGPGRFDTNHYDLLASEARTSSLFAIAENEVSRSHWLHLNRPFTSIDGIPTLISWNGSMFEYLMPNLFTRTYPETLLYQTSKGVVEAQIDYARKNHVPWGISESGYYKFDQAKNYQYKGFGVPALGRKRGLADDLVIAPYASLMAVGIDPENVLRNISNLEDIGALGVFGFYESIDFTESRLPDGKEKAIIKSYMAHHQGMIFVALSNFLNQVALSDRIHKDPRIQSTELLLQEQIPHVDTHHQTHEGKVSGIQRESQTVSISAWPINIKKPGKSLHVVSNKKMHYLMSETGSGYLALGDIALTRWREDEALDPWGIWFYVQDLESKKIWSIGQQPIQVRSQEYQVSYAPHMMEIRHVVDDIRIILQVAIAPDDNVCFHKIRITNQSSKTVNYRILSYGEVVLAPQSTDAQHPAFNKMFIESELNKFEQMLYFNRRKRSTNEPLRGMAHVLIDKIPGEIEYESNRADFLGRGLDVTNPAALHSQEKLIGSVGHTLDPIFSMGKRFMLEPNQNIRLDYLTLFAEDESSAKSLAKKYEVAESVDNAFTAAESASEQQLRSLEMTTKQLENYQELLSKIIYPSPDWRMNPSIFEENILGQSGLWAFGISGDYPVLLALIDQDEQVEDLQELLKAHKYWQRKGLKIDFIILITKPGGYSQSINEKIHKLISIMDSQSLVNQRGGIFVLTSSQIESNALKLIKASAQAVIDLESGDLGDHLAYSQSMEPNLPYFIPTDPDKEFTTIEKMHRPDDLIFDNGIGGFSGNEYWIYLEDYPKLAQGLGQVPPAPWINVISNEYFGFLISESGSGFTWSRNSGENRLSPWHNDPVSDPASECLYLRDEINGRIWSPTPQPSGKGIEYLVKHGQGYTIFESYNQGYKQELKVFVDPEDPVKIIELKLTNQTSEYRRLTATYYTEWVLGPKREKMKEYIVPSYHSKSGTLLAKNPYNEEFAERVAFLSANQDPHGLTTDRKDFFGSPGNREFPAGLMRVGLSGKLQAGVDPCGALQTHWNFEPGETQTIIYIIGQGNDRDHALKLAEALSETKNAQESFERTRIMWDSILNKLHVETPDKEMNMVLNRWLLYQALSCRIWGRSALYQSSGAYGFRDQLQDIASFLSIKPEIAREHILRAAMHQFDAGDVLHWWHPPTGRGVRTRITDDLLWLVYITYEYIKKTGDRSILGEEVPFKLGEPLKEDEEERYGYYETTQETYSLFEHCMRALEKGDTQGPHGLPLIGSGDWNDGMNRVGIEGKGESVWLAWFLLENHNRFAQLCEWFGRDDLINKHRKRSKELANVINRAAWDGQWYLRGYYDDGTPLGSHRNAECQIDSLPQSWSVLSGNAPLDRAEKSLMSLDKYLVNTEERLIKLFTPPFDKTDKDPGYIKGYPPGVRENGGQYTHAAIWAVWALTEIGYGTKAYEQFKLLNPISHSLKMTEANLYKVEPYVIAADIYSRSPYTGRGGWTWYTGSSGWFYRLGVEAILGFSTAGDHIEINPCIPEDWDSFSIRYVHNGSNYHIQVMNPEHIQKGVKLVEMDGKTLEDKAIPLVEDQADHNITVLLGD